MTPSPENSSISQIPSPAREEIRAGRYVVVGLLGSGSQGETLEAVDKREGRPVAIKRFTVRGAKSWKDVELAEREAAVLASLSHPGLPRYIEHFEENGALYLVMEKIEGETLASRRKRGAPLTQEQVLRFLRETGECLRYLHGHAPPIVHRDIKPGNVILRPDGSYCLVDFGSVRDRLKPEGGSTVVGTFGFMAPEQFQGRAAPGSDVYAVGATALSLLSGSEPEDLPHKGLGIDVETALRGQIDRRLIGVLRAMLEPDPDRRASSIDAVLVQHGLGPEAGLGAQASPAHAAKHARRARLEADGKDRGQARRTRREAREQRKAERHARRGQRHQGNPEAVQMLVVGVARLAVFALFHLLLPVLFTLLSIVWGPRMLRRRQRMIEIGNAGLLALDRHLHGPEHTELQDPTPAERARVAAETEAETVAQRARAEAEATAQSVQAGAQSLEARIEAELEAAAEAIEARLEGRDRERRRP